MFPKSKRVSDPELLEVVRELPCLACLRTPCDPHHLTTRGAGGGDTADNLIPLCRTHHQEWHAKGAVYMSFTYKAIEGWLELAGRTDVLEAVRLTVPSPL